MWRGILVAGLTVVPVGSASVADFVPRAPVVVLEQERAGSAADDMVLIPAGAFAMGLNRGREDFSPEHRVDLDAFYIDRHEVTNAEYERFDPNHRRDAASSCDDCAVTNVSWSEAGAYCRWAGKRLPTEAEWEKAARGPELSLYGYANEYRPEMARSRAEAATRVGTYAPNGYGVFDALGNVWEWCADYWDKRYYRQSPERNPQGPSRGPGRVIRGGSYKNGSEVHLATRSWSRPGYRYRSIGFRCARDGPRAGGQGNPEGLERRGGAHAVRLSVATNFEPDLIEAIKACPVYELFGKLAARSGRRRTSLLHAVARLEAGSGGPRAPGPSKTGCASTAS